MARHAFAQLHQRVLNVARFLRVVDVLIEFAVGERAAEPRAVPEQKRQQHDCPGDHKEEDAVADRHASALEIGVLDNGRRRSHEFLIPRYRRRARAADGDNATWRTAPAGWWRRALPRRSTRHWRADDRPRAGMVRWS